MSNVYKNVVNFVFPQAKKLNTLSSSSRKKFEHYQQMESSLLLQSFIYYNHYYSIIYFFLNILTLRWKLLNFTGWRAEGVTLIVYIIWLIAEPFRIYNGYKGNLQENVPSLVAFTFLSMFPQIICCIYFMLIQQPLLPLDRILNIIMLCVLIFQLVISFIITNKIIRNKTARFAIEYGAVDKELGLDDIEMTNLKAQDHENDQLNPDNDDDDNSSSLSSSSSDHDQHDTSSSSNTYYQKQNKLKAQKISKLNLIAKNRSAKDRRQKERAYARRKKQRLKQQNKLAKFHTQNNPNKTDDDGDSSSSAGF